MTAARCLTAEEVQGRIDGTPFFCWLGVRAKTVTPKRIVLTADTAAEMFGNPEVGAVHGGVFASLIEIACSYTVIAPTARTAATVDLRVDYHRPGIGSHFTVAATPIRRGRTVTLSEAQVMDDHGRVVASGRAMMIQRAD